MYSRRISTSKHIHRQHNRLGLGRVTAVETTSIALKKT